MPPSTESSKQLQQLAAAVKEQQKKIWVLEKKMKIYEKNSRKRARKLKEMEMEMKNQSVYFVFSFVFCHLPLRHFSHLI